MTYIIVFLLCVIIVLLISGLLAIYGLVNNIYEMTANAECRKENKKVTTPDRPLEQEFYVGDFVTVVPLNAEGIVVNASMGAYDVCTDGNGSEVFEGMTADDMRLIHPSHLFNGDWDA